MVPRIPGQIHGEVGKGMLRFCCESGMIKWYTT